MEPVGAIKRVLLQTAEVLALSEEDKDAIKFGGYLHDIGKIGVRDGVLLKPGPLTEAEHADVRLHPIIAEGYFSSKGTKRKRWIP
jgi:response regulator RpfG family c-di-GMP phosphodiesterase